MFCSPTGMYNNHGNGIVRTSQLFTLVGQFPVHVVDLYQHCFSRTDAYCTDYCCMFSACAKQLYEWYFPSVCLSICLSVCFSGVITNDPSKVHAKGQGQRSQVKVTEVKTQFNRFQTVTPARIHI